MYTKKLILLTSIMIMQISMASLVNAEESESPQPRIYAGLTARKEAKISFLKTMAVKDVIQNIQDEDFIIDDGYANRAINVALADRKEESLDTALDLLKRPKVEIIDGRRTNRSDQILVAKKILQVFQEEGLNRISGIYSSSEPTAKANFIEALGGMSGSEPNDMLVAALDDKSFCEADPETEGEPMRVCDAAYNQLVLKYKIPDVLRTIGPAYTIDQRDYFISVLKEKL